MRLAGFSGNVDRQCRPELATHVITRYTPPQKKERALENERYCGMGGKEDARTRKEDESEERNLMPPARLVGVLPATSDDGET